MTRPRYNDPMPSKRDKASENPYEPPLEPTDDALMEPRSGSLPWWLRPGGTPSILAALPFFIVLMVAIAIGLLLPMIQWLTGN